MGNSSDKDKEFISQGLDLIIEDTKYAVTSCTGELKNYREDKLDYVLNLKKRLQDSKQVIID